MIGEALDCEVCRELFGWPEAMIQIQPDGSDIIAVLNGIGSNPERIAAISRRNTKEIPLHHDWTYRWNEMFRVVGVELAPCSEHYLKDMADLVGGAPMTTMQQPGA